MMLNIFSGTRLMALKNVYLVGIKLDVCGINVPKHTESDLSQQCDIGEEGAIDFPPISLSRNRMAMGGPYLPCCDSPGIRLQK